MKAKQDFTTIGVRFTVEQKRRLADLANQMKVSPNAMVGILIDNAQIEVVKRHEPVARLMVNEG